MLRGILKLLVLKVVSVFYTNSLTNLLAILINSGEVIKISFVIYVTALPE
jgi:hypothetical protein